MSYDQNLGSQFAQYPPRPNRYPPRPAQAPDVAQPYQTRYGLTSMIPSRTAGGGKRAR